MSTLELNSLKYTVIEELMSIDNPESLSKIEKYVRKIKQTLTDAGKEQFKQTLKNDLQEAWQEMKDIKAGKAEPLTMEDLYAELEEVPSRRIANHEWSEDFGMYLA